MSTWCILLPHSAGGCELQSGADRSTDDVIRLTGSSSLQNAKPAGTLTSSMLSFLNNNVTLGSRICKRTFYGWKAARGMMDIREEEAAGEFYFNQTRVSVFTLFFCWVCVFRLTLQVESGVWHETYGGCFWFNKEGLDLQGQNSKTVVLVWHRNFTKKKEPETKRIQSRTKCTK